MTDYLTKVDPSEPERVARSRLISLAQLREQWATKWLIARFLPDYADLYSLALIEQIESTPAFASARQWSERRRAAVARGVETKRRKTIEIATALPIPMREIVDRDTLVLRVCEYRSRIWSGLKWPILLSTVTPNTAPAVVNRLIVENLRLDAAYDLSRHPSLKGRVGIAEAGSIAYQRSVAAIREAYPWLAYECDQLEGHAATMPEGGPSEQSC